MFRQSEATCFKHQDSVLPRNVTGEQMLRENASEGAAPYDHDIKRSRVRPQSSVRALKRLVQTVAGIATQNVAGEVGVLCRGTCHFNLCNVLRTETSCIEE